MLLRGKVEGGLLAPGAQGDVGGFVGALRNAGFGDIGKPGKQGVQRFAHAAFFGFAGGEAFLETRDLFDQIACVLALGLARAHLLRGFVSARLQVLQLGLGGPMATVEIDNLRRSRLQPPTRQSGIEGVRGLAYPFEVEHGSGRIGCERERTGRRL